MPLVQTKMVVSKGNKYDHVAMLTRDEACQLIERAIVTKERKITTSTGRLIEIGYAVLPQAIEGVLNIMYKLEPEEAPQGKENTETAKGNKEQLKAFNQLLQGAL